MASVSATPMMQQYLSIKEQHRDAILFYRMGDFYEMFFEDARTAAPVLEIALTSRNKNDPDPIPMCGVPVKAADSYIGRLIEKGFKVAVCEQTEDPAAAKGLVRRDVVRVVTPGMVIDNALLEKDTNNYVLSLTHADGVAGFSCVDISTGAFRVCESADFRAVRHELLRIGPREVVIPESGPGDPALAPLIALFPPAALTFLPDREFEPAAARRRLIDQFQTRSLDGFGCQGLAPGIGAAGALLFYVNETQKQKAAHLTGLEVYNIDQYLLMDDVTCRNLELVANLRDKAKRGTLIEVLDLCVTAMGSRLMRHWMLYPLLSAEAIRRRLDAVAEAREGLGARKAAREQLKNVYDIERLASRAVMGRANPRDLLALKQTLFALPGLMSELAAYKSPLFSFADTLGPDDPARLSQLAGVLEAAVREDAPVSVAEGGVIKPDYHPELAELVSISRDSKTYLARLETTEREKTGISTLKVRYNKVFGYYIEVPRSQDRLVPAHYVRKQTLVNGERYITDELKEFEAKALGAEEQRIRL
ncbi:MAG: DNA mismatch repair protein MutS, partial [Thermodesulfobacteriota bacterium]